MATISVIIPTYNAERTILETIESVQKQTFKDFEIVIINDGSSDRTLNLVDEIGDNRIKIFTYENGGLPTARNRGISHSTGEFITFLDADDLWTPNKLERQLNLLNANPEADVAYSWTYFMDESENARTINPGDPVYLEGNVYANLLSKNFIASGSNVLITREAVETIGEFDPECGGSADWDYWIRLASQYSFVVVPEHQIYYRRSAGAMSSKIDKMKLDCLTVFEKTFQSAPLEFQCLKGSSLAWIHQYFTDLYLRYSCDKYSNDQAALSLWKSIRLEPTLLLQEHTWKLTKWLIKKRIFPGKANI